MNSNIAELDIREIENCTGGSCRCACIKNNEKPVIYGEVEDYNQCQIMCTTRNLGKYHTCVEENINFFIYYSPMGNAFNVPKNIF